MKTIQAILDLVDQAPPNDALAMATVVNVRGSAYRRPGARMLCTSSGRTAGMISGGCLENDAHERCREVIASGAPKLVTYDSTAPEDIVFGLGLGCNGIVEVLFEPIPRNTQHGLLSLFAACAARRQAGRIATVFRSPNIALGSRLLRWPDGTITAGFRDRVLASCLGQAFQNAGTKRNLIWHVDLPDGRSGEVLLETIMPPVSLTVFGAADDALPLVNLAKSIGWRVTVIDGRPAYATSARFPQADAVHCLRPETFLTSPKIVIAPDSFVVVMTHSFSADLEILRQILPRSVGYLGVLGPKSRCTRLIEILRGEGVNWDEQDLAKLHGPTGLDIGAETPEEIAISIVAEMQAVLMRRAGGALQYRSAPIHDPVELAKVRT